MIVFVLVLLFVVVPIAELSLLIRIGSMIGVLDTVLLVLLTGVCGAVMVRAAGLQCLWRIRQSVAQGRVPADELLNGLCILIAGAFLITPGLITDSVGVLLLLPPTRDAAERAAVRLVRKKINRDDISTTIHF